MTRPPGDEGQRVTLPSGDEGERVTLPSGDEGERVTLVDDDDRPVGTAPKLAAHRTGALHRAVSVFVTDGRGRVLLQQRAASKYHSPGRWSNTCCGHPRPDEATGDAAARRLREEMGILCALTPAGSFRYRADLGDGWIEHEIDHVLVGRCDARPHPDPTEVAAWRWVDVASLETDLAAHPERYSAWLGQALGVARTHPLLAAMR